MNLAYIWTAANWTAFGFGLGVFASYLSAVFIFPR
jgi:hypothetical protein